MSPSYSERPTRHASEGRLLDRIGPVTSLVTSPVTCLALAACFWLGCAHRGIPAPEGPGQRFQVAAGRLGGLEFEDEAVEARLVFQALPASSPERAPLRAKLARYFLQPLVALDASRLRQEARDLGTSDVFDRIFESLRDACNLYEPQELWAQPPAIPPGELELLNRSAQLVLSLFGPRGAESQSALALAVLVTIDPGAREWSERFDRLLAWTEEAGFGAENGPRRSLTAVDLLQSVLGDWPAPGVADRLTALYVERQRRFSSILRKPLPGGEEARKALGDLLLAQGDEMQRTVASVGAIYLRCGRLDRAGAATASLADKPGDEPELRALIAAALDATAGPDATMRLARRFLPRVDFLGGTATDNPDLAVAFRVLQLGLLRAPGNPDLLILSAEVSKLVSAPFLAIRQLEEAEQVLEHDQAASSDLLARVSAELLDLYFLRLRLALDPERAALPPSDEVERMRRRASDVRKRFQGTEIHVKDAQIDFELARSYVNAGLIDRAEPLFQRAQGEDSDANPEIAAEFATLILKRGHPQQASKILRDGLSALENAPHSAETIGGVEGRSGLERLLGDALDIGGDRSGAEQAWRSAVAGWERLMIEQLHRKNYARSAEATFEIGRVLYALGRHAEGMQKFDEAIEQDGDRSIVHRRHRLPGPERRGRGRRRHSPARPFATRSQRLRIREGLLVAVDPRPHQADPAHRRPHRRGLPADAGSAAPRDSPAARFSLVPTAGGLRHRTPGLRAASGPGRLQRQAGRGVLLPRHATAV